MLWVNGQVSKGIRQMHDLGAVAQLPPREPKLWHWLEWGNQRNCSSTSAETLLPMTLTFKIMSNFPRSFYCFLQQSVCTCKQGGIHPGPDCFPWHFGLMSWTISPAACELLKRLAPSSASCFTMPARRNMPQLLIGILSDPPKNSHASRPVLFTPPPIPIGLRLVQSES
jgi:hypothetical protein